jgi:hypothetical protein
MKSWIELEAPEARDTQILDCMFINVTSMDVKHIYIVVRGDRQVESMIGDTSQRHCSQIFSMAITAEIGIS